VLSRLALRCRGDWIRTSDLLNPIQAVTTSKTAEKTSISALTSFHTLQGLQGIRKVRIEGAAKVLQVTRPPIAGQQFCREFVTTRIQPKSAT
jgi:hypothetical protein